MDGWNTIFILIGLFPGIMLVSGRVGFGTRRAGESLTSSWENHSEKCTWPSLKFAGGTHPKTNIAPSEKGWLEDDPFLLKWSMLIFLLGVLFLLLIARSHPAPPGMYVKIKSTKFISCYLSLRLFLKKPSQDLYFTKHFFLFGSLFPTESWIYGPPTS